MSAPFDYSAAAELYSSMARLAAGNSRYLRFPSAAEAIRFAIEDMPRRLLPGAAMEVGDDRFEGEAIRALYLSADYPLRRAEG